MAAAARVAGNPATAGGGGRRRGRTARRPVLRLRGVRVVRGHPAGRCRDSLQGGCPWPPPPNCSHDIASRIVVASITSNNEIFWFVLLLD